MSVIDANTNQNSTEGVEINNQNGVTEVTENTNDLVSQSDIETQQMRETIRKKLGSKIMKKDTENTPQTNEKKEAIKSTLVNPKYDLYLNELAPYVDEAKTLIKDLYTKTVRLTYNYIQMGNIFTKCKDELSKDDLLKLQKYFDLDERTVYRYTNLVKDDRVSRLTIDELSTMLKPSMSKLIKMSKLEDDEDFTTVLSGEDKPLLSLNVDKDISNPFSTHLDDDSYKKLIKMTKVEIIEFFVSELTKKENVFNELCIENEHLIDIVQSNNLYDYEKEAS